VAIEIENSTGLNVNDLKELKDLCNEVAKANLKREQCYDICTAVQTFIERKLVVPVSLFDAMEEREKKKKEIIENVKKPKSSNLINDISIDEVREDSENLHRGLLKLPVKTTTSQPPPQLQPIKPSTVNQIKPPATMASPAVGTNLFSNSSAESSLLSPSQFDMSKSRYLQEFEQIELLGKGGQGEVWKVQHKLDRGYYAVKRIDLTKDMENSNKIIREVKTVSRLIHKNIVRYYAAWIEEYPPLQNLENSPQKKNDNNNNNKTKQQQKRKNRFATSSTSDSETRSDESADHLAYQQGNLLIMENEAMLNELDNHKLSKGFNRNNNNNKANIYFEDDEEEEEDNDYNEDNEKDDFGFEFDHGDDDDDGEEDEEEDEEIEVAEIIDSQNIDVSGFGGNTQLKSYGYQYASDSDSSSQQQEEEDDDDNDNNNSDSDESYYPQKRKPSNLGLQKQPSETTTTPLSSIQPIIPYPKFLFIQMEYCYNTLRTLIDDGSVWHDEMFLQKLFRQLLDGLGYMHSRLLIHRDLKVCLFIIIIFFFC
jgi:serine/threonine protein kinase